VSVFGRKGPRSRREAAINCGNSAQLGQLCRKHATYPSESVANRSYLAEDCTKSLLFRSRSHSALRPCRKRRRPKLSPFSRKSAFSKDAGPTKAKVRWLTRADNGPRFTGRLPRRTHRRSLRTQTSGVGEMRLLFCS
jgi:hypothetical protein